MEIVSMKLADLTGDTANARTHSDENLAAIRASLEAHGQVEPLVVQQGGWVIAGNGRLEAMRQLGWEQAQVVLLDIPDQEARALSIRLNRTGELAGWDLDLLAGQLQALEAAGEPLEGLGWDASAWDELLTALEPPQEPQEPPPPPPLPPPEPVSKPGEVYQLGPHRLVCGDSTDPETLLLLLDKGERFDLLHADPPYGMGKESDGVLNDNLYRDKLDAFQMQWWRLWRKHSSVNVSAYIWGLAADLWRLWYQGGLAASEDRILVRNELVWDKTSGMGMRSDHTHQYATATERCLFLMCGPQFLGNQNLADYWEGYEPLRTWLCEQRDAAGWKNKDVNRITGTHMAGHWFGKSQFQIISEGNYVQLQEAADGVAFVLSYAEVRRQFATVWDGGNAHRLGLAAAMRENRSYFDNAHDSMTDVWRFSRVVGDDRFGHATPKPVGMIQRCIVSSCPKGGIVGEPFGGTGSTLIACAMSGRSCRTAELFPAYCDVIRRRWAAYAQQRGLDVGDGLP